MRRPSSRPSWPLSPPRTIPSTGRELKPRSTGSWDATGSIGRSTTSRPEAAATGSATRTINGNEGAESTLAFHRAQLSLDAAGAPRRPSPPSGTESTGGRVTTLEERPSGLAAELFVRHPAQSDPDAPRDWPYRVNAVFNPAAALVDGETVLLARVEDRTGISHLTVARSSNGVDGWTIDSEPLLAPEPAPTRQRSGDSKTRVPSGSRSSTGSRSPALRTALPARPSSWRRPPTSPPSSGTASSSAPRTRTPPSCPNASTASGSSSTVP